jgi:hypothetical protein
MNATLRDTLRALPPEPPDDLGLPSTARRRAQALRRRRYAAVSAGAVAAVTAFALVASGAVLPDASRRVRPVTGDPLVGDFPDWPRRGDVKDVDVELAAVEAWQESLHRRGVAPVGGTRVLYAGGGAERPVVVLHGTAEVGGDRLVVVTFDGGRPDVFADRPAPLPGVGALRIAIPGQGGSHRPLQDMCPVVGREDPSAVRLLVVGAPGTRSARWRRSEALPAECGARGDTGAEWEDVPLRDGAGLVTLPFDSRTDVWAEVRAPGPYVVTGTPMIWARSTGTYGPLTAAGGATGVARRTDGSRADDLADAVIATALPDGRRCETQWAQSLPDGTPVVLCHGLADGGGIESAVFVAEDGEHRVRAYDVPVELGGDSFTAVIQGHTARWVVFCGMPMFPEATLIRGDVRRPFPLTLGAGFLRLDRGQPVDGARVTSGRYGPDGGIHLVAPEGREIGGRAGR